jgi:hypothetical protein
MTGTAQSCALSYRAVRGMKQLSKTCGVASQGSDAVAKQQSQSNRAVEQRRPFI